MLSSSESVFEKQKFRCQLQESHDPLGGGPRGSIERFILTLAELKTRLPLDC